MFAKYEYSKLAECVELNLAELEHVRESQGNVEQLGKHQEGEIEHGWCPRRETGQVMSKGEVCNEMVSVLQHHLPLNLPVTS